MHKILIVDDMKTIREQFAYDIQRKTGFEVLTAANGRDGLEILQREDIDVMILDLEMPVMDGLETLEAMKKQGFDDVAVLVYTAKGNYQSCVRATRLGAYNFFAKDEINLDQLIHNIENSLEHRKLLVENRALRRAAGRDSSFIGESDTMRALRELVRKIARVPSNVLIVGESGSGKELVAREIHRLSPRAKKPFVALNCAAIPENLVESELFGFEKGAFSGAIRPSKGKFQVADGGTLMLDEIGDMPMAIQAKLLRVLQENEFSRLGGEDRVVKVNVRVIAATHRELEQEIADGRFRQDLFYRICTHIVRVPPLRERLEDVGPLTIHFVNRICERFGMTPKTAHPATIELLKKYDWRKNNVRELENIVERMIIQCEGAQLNPGHIPSDIVDPGSLPLNINLEEEKVQPGEANDSRENGSGNVETNKSYRELKQDAERKILTDQLKVNNWHITKTAQALGITNHSNLLKIMRRLGIKKPKK